MSDPSPSRWLHRLALSTAGVTFLLVVAGGLVWATESALACPDWPLCHGEAFPQLTGRVLFEVGHRYIAGTVSVLTLALAIWMSWKLKGWRRGVGVLALLLVLAQALLGALTVWLKLPLLVRVAHLAISQAFFASVIWTVFATRTPVSSRATVTTGTRTWAGLAAVAAYLQLLLGAFVRHTGAGLACNASVFTCNDSLWPAAQPEFGALGPAQVVTLHKAFALVVAALVFAAAWRVLRQDRETQLPRRLALTACALVLLQIGLGVVSVLTFLGIAMVTAHLATGSLLFVSVLSLYLALGELGASEPVRVEAGIPAGAALGAH